MFVPCPGGQEEGGERGSRGALSSEEGDLPQGSSLELSPSNSSGGTYMWDEEGLEPLGGPASHPCDSYDNADLNSMVGPHCTAPDSTVLL